MTYYIQPHLSQYDTGNDAVTRSAGCTWCSLTNGIRAISGGRYKPTPDYIHSLVPRSEETNPTTPGWSLGDAVRAAGRYGVQLSDHTGEGWAALEKLHDSGHSILVQGDSDQFPNGTCSGDFNGDHCIHVHPATKLENGITYWWIDDPVCPEGRWADKNTIRKYAEKLYPAIRFAVFVQPVPELAWTWRGTPPLFMSFQGVDVKRDSWTSRKQIPTNGTRRYRTTTPKDFHNPEYGTKRLVLLGLLVTGQRGAYTGMWVAAEGAEELP